MNDNNKRLKIGKLSGIIGIIANVLLASAKLFAGILSASISIIADALNNFTDCISSVLTTIGFKLSQKPADADHPYGHARFEYVSSLIISVLIIFVGFELAKSSIEKIISPTSVAFTTITLIILCVSILVKFVLYLFNISISKKIDSSTLKATATDCRNDVIMTSVVLCSFLVEKFTGYQIDGYVSLAVALFILISGILLAKENASPILGQKNDGHLKSIILNKINDYPIVLGYHDLMIHDYGPGISFCSIHFEIDKNLDTLYVHEIIDKFEREMLDYGTTLTVHYDPVVTDSPLINSLKHEVVCTLVEVDNRLSIHDFRLIPCDGFKKIFFDLPLPLDLEDKKENLTRLIEDRVNSLGFGRFEVIITFDSEAFN